jgi:hypothetical protein
MILRELEVEELGETEAEDALRQVLHAARAPTRPAWPADAGTRDMLSEALAGLDTGEDLHSAPDADVARDTLLLLKEDPARAALRTDATDGGRHARSDFSGGALEYMEATTLALVALSTYVRVERDAKGRWRFVFEVRPQTDGMKKAFVKLVSALVTKLPTD